LLHRLSLLGGFSQRLPFRLTQARLAAPNLDPPDEGYAIAQISHLHTRLPNEPSNDTLNRGFYAFLVPSWLLFGFVAYQFVASRQFA
jgi:hypothetical protein